VVRSGDLDNQGVDRPDFDLPMGGTCRLRERGTGGVGVGENQNPAGRKARGRPCGIARALIGLTASGRRLDHDERRI
jgi:hypothetical protein